MPVVTLNELELIRWHLVPSESTRSPGSLRDSNSPHLGFLNHTDGRRPHKLKVPCIIHQIYWNFKTGETDIPYKWQPSKEAWINYHPDFIYIQWTGKMLRSVISDYYPFFLNQYDNYEHDIQRADSARAFILHRYGGIYSDMNMEPNCNVWHLFNGQEDIYIVNDSGRYTNMLMASPPLSPFWPYFWKYLKDPYIPSWAITHHFYIQASTGPLLIDRALKRYHGTIGLLPGPYVQPCTACETRPCTKPGAYFTMLDGGSWNKWDSRCVEVFACHWPIVILIIAAIVVLILLYYIYQPRIRRRIM